MEITDARCVWLTTLRPDGSPHTTPVWFLLTRNTFWVASGSRNAKVRHLRRDPRVSLAVDASGAAPVVAEGAAFLHEDLGAHPEPLAGFAAKYEGWDVADPDPDGPRVLIEVPVRRWLFRPVGPPPG